MSPDVEVSRDIDAPPPTVFAALADITRMGEWSPETYAAEWIDGATEAAVGARFLGHNRHGGAEWTTQAEIVELVPDVRFAFDCTFRDVRFATWAYTVEATDRGCRVTESWQDHRPDELRCKPSMISGVADRARHNAAGMTETLARLAAAVE